jgi:hypothetical protein
MRLLAHLPALAAPRTDHALVICIGTGSTAAALLTHPFRRVDAVDIDDSIGETLPYFRHVNGGFPGDDRARVIVADGFKFVQLPDRRYDVITLEPPPPRAPGGSTLYSIELYRALRGSLRPGGVVAQWLPLHGLSGTEAGAIATTFFAAFPRGGLYLAERNEAILLSTAPARTPAGRPSAGARADLAHIGFGDRDPLADLLVASPADVRAAGETELIRQAWPLPELAPYGPGSDVTLDVWLERVLSARARTGFAAHVAPIAPAFIRIQTGRASTADARAVRDALMRLRDEDPENPYTQYMFGRGPHLENRVTAPP